MNTLTRILTTPTLLRSLSPGEFFELKVQADAAGLMGRIWYLACAHEITLPDYAAWHFQGAARAAERQRVQAIREVSELAELFHSLDVEFVLLKGAAYVALDLPVARGRSFADIDILVPRDKLTLVERQLRLYHWVRTEIDDYDERYYRKWMHEIPPLRHARRGTVLDVHHNILPLTSRDAPDIGRFQIQETVLPDSFGGRLGGTVVRTLSDVDLCLHSAVHLFAESEFHNGLRDLSDLDMMLRYMCAGDVEFPRRLLQRGRDLGLASYAQLALRYCRRILATPLPADVVGEEKKSISAGILDFGFNRVFTPAHTACRRPGHGLGTLLLYCRGHWLRMPLYLLVPHLARKAATRLGELFRAREPEGADL